jgi:hypothetical protein
MKNLPSTVFMAAVLLVLPLAITACDRKTETKVVKEAAPAAAPAPAHETTIINEHTPAPVVHDTTIIKETDQDRRDHDHDHDHDHDNH